MSRPDVLDIGLPPPEPEQKPEPAPAPTESFQAKARRRAEEEEMRQKLAEGFGSMTVYPVFWYDELAGDEPNPVVLDCPANYEELVMAREPRAHWPVMTAAPNEPLELPRAGLQSVTLQNGLLVVVYNGTISMWNENVHFTFSDRDPGDEA